MGWLQSCAIVMAKSRALRSGRLGAQQGGKDEE